MTVRKRQVLPCTFYLTWNEGMIALKVQRDSPLLVLEKTTFPFPMWLEENILWYSVDEGEDIIVAQGLQEGEEFFLLFPSGEPKELQGSGKLRWE